MRYLRLVKPIMNRSRYGMVILAFALLVCVPRAQAWDHPSHMTTAAIAFAEIERAKPKLIEKLEVIFMKHPDTSPFWADMSDGRQECVLPKRMEQTPEAGAEIWISEIRESCFALCP